MKLLLDNSLEKLVNKLNFLVEALQTYITLTGSHGPKHYGSMWTKMTSKVVFKEIFESEIQNSETSTTCKDPEIQEAEIFNFTDSLSENIEEIQTASAFIVNEDTKLALLQNVSRTYSEEFKRLEERIEKARQDLIILYNNVRLDFANLKLTIDKDEIIKSYDKSKKSWFTTETFLCVLKPYDKKSLDYIKQSQINMLKFKDTRQEIKLHPVQTILNPFDMTNIQSIDRSYIYMPGVNAHVYYDFDKLLSDKPPVIVVNGLNHEVIDKMNTIIAVPADKAPEASKEIVGDFSLDSVHFYEGQDPMFFMGIDPVVKELNRIKEKLILERFAEPIEIPEFDKNMFVDHARLIDETVKYFRSELIKLPEITIEDAEEIINLPKINNPIGKALLKITMQQLDKVLSYSRFPQSHRDEIKTIMYTVVMENTNRFIIQMRHKLNFKYVENVNIDELSFALKRNMESSIGEPLIKYFSI